VRLGRAIALRLAAEGAHVAIQFSRSIDAARETLADLGAAGVRTAAVQADFAVDPRSAARHVVDEATFAVGPLDLLVNSAAIFEPGSLATLTPDAWNRHHRINLEAPLWLMQEFAAQLPTDREGDVVNIVDWRGMRPPPGHLAYTLSKAGLVAATRLLAQELAPRIRVNAVAPGAILPAPGSSPDVFARLADRIPLGRTGSPDDIAAAVVYFAAARFITGEVLCVTGGQQL